MSGRGESYFYYTLLISTRFYDYEYGESEPGLAEVEFNSREIWQLADQTIAAFRADRVIWGAYVGISPDYDSLYRIESGNLTSSEKYEEFSMNPERIKAFQSLAEKDLTKWPGDIDHFSLTLVFSDGFGMPTDLDLKTMSHEANIDCESVVQDPDSGMLVCQGYEMGEYETGYFSNGHDDIYKLDHKYQTLLKGLQSEETIRKLIVK